MDATAHQLSLSPTLLAAVGSGAPLGPRGEALAAHHLVADDQLTLVDRNWRLRTGALRGELDLVAYDAAADTLVVCEVKARRDAARFGGPLAAVDRRKQARIRALTGAYLQASRRSVAHVRIDVIAIDLGGRPSLTHLPAVL